MLREAFSHAFLTLYCISLDFLRFLGSLLQSRSALAAENLFLRKQLAVLAENSVGIVGVEVETPMELYSRSHA